MQSSLDSISWYLQKKKHQNKSKNIAKRVNTDIQIPFTGIYSSSYTFSI